jgi:hypothetical protein
LLDRWMPAGGVLDGSEHVIFLGSPTLAIRFCHGSPRPFEHNKPVSAAEVTTERRRS